MSVTMFSVELSTAGPCLEVFLSGDLDLESAPTLRAMAEALDPTCRQVVLDLSGVTFLDSTGISALVGLQHACEPALRTLVIRGARGQVRDVLEISGVGEVLQIVA
jgi:anti-anti-sigma factor